VGQAIKSPAKRTGLQVPEENLLTKVEQIMISRFPRRGKLYFGSSTSGKRGAMEAKDFTDRNSSPPRHRWCQGGSGVRGNIRPRALAVVRIGMADVNWNDVLVGLGVVLLLGIGAGILSVELEEIRRRRGR
jgi:hypothetical protein